MIYRLCRLAFLGGITCLLCLFNQGSKAGTLPYPGDTIRRFTPRLVLLLTDTSEAAKEQRTQLFYEQLKNKFYRRDVTRKIYDLLFDTPTGGQPQRSYDTEEALEYFSQFEGKVIQEIRIKKLSLFGPSVNDTTRRASNWIQHTGNALHFQTRDWVIHKNLLFQQGDLIDAEALYDNERLLRSLSYIRDARIRVISIPDNPHAVAIEVITQDVFPLSFDAGRGHFSSYSLSVQNNNIFGIGHRLTTEGLYRSDGSPALGYAGSYTVQNVNGSFINATLSGSYTDIRRGAGLSLQRPFFTPDIRWAGGLELQRLEQINVVLHRDYTKDTLAWYSHDLLDFWAGHSIPLNGNKPHPKGRESVVLAGRGMRISHYQTPGGELAGNDFFLDRKLLLGSVGWVRRQYRRDAYIHGFGRTEDVPLGATVNITYGVEQQQEMMYYGQLSAAWGGYKDRVGYLDFRGTIGQYMGVGDEASRRVRYGSASLISKLMPKGKYKFRQLIRLDYLYGDRRYTHEFVTVGDREIRGVRGIPFRGTQRINASFETIAFTPVKFIGFRLAAFAFADFAVLNDKPYLTLEGEFLHGYGLGFRVRNENFVFKTFQLRFSYYPAAGGGFAVSIMGSPNSIFREYFLGRPDTYPFH